jgi:leucyl-tRNA synthetase
MFAAPLELGARWDPQGVPGSHRFLSRVWNLVGEYTETDEAELSDDVVRDLNRAIHGMIKKMNEDIEHERYNTAIAAAMACTNELYKLKTTQFGKHPVWQETLESLVACVAPFAPHLGEELWFQLGHSKTIHKDSWPQYDEKYLVQDTVTVAVQVNGKLRGEVEVAADAPEATVVTAAQANDKVAGYLKDQAIKKTIYVPGRLVNFVV